MLKGIIIKNYLYYYLKIILLSLVNVRTIDKLINFKNLTI
jgi:hypothetical protein